MLPVAPAALRRQASAIGPLRSLDCPDSGSPPWLAGTRAGSDCSPGHSRATAPGVPAPLRQRPGWRASVVAIANRPCAHSLPTHVPGQAHGRPGKRSPRLRRRAVRPGAHARRAVPGSGHTAGEPTTAMGRKPSTKKTVALRATEQQHRKWRQQRLAALAGWFKDRRRARIACGDRCETGPARKGPVPRRAARPTPAPPRRAQCAARP